MQLAYYAHSYREEDAGITEFVLELIKGRDITVSLDPPTDNLNSAKLERHLRESDGLVAVLTARDHASWSPYIAYEIALGIRSRKPVLVFVEDLLPRDAVPDWIVSRRFSRKAYARQLRELRHGLDVFEQYLSDDPPARYQAATTPRSCVLIGFDHLNGDPAPLNNLFETRGYALIDGDEVASSYPLGSEVFQALGDADVAIALIGSRDPKTAYLVGAAQAALVPLILLDTRGHPAPASLPEEFLPRRIDPADPEGIVTCLETELDIFEQDFLELGSPDVASQYVKQLLDADKQRARRGSFGSIGDWKVFMGDQVNISHSQVGAVGDNATVAGNTFQQMWSEQQSKIDLNVLAEELARLRAALSSPEQSAEEAAALGEVAAAELHAKEGDGPGTLERLRAAGAWVLKRAEEIGTKLVVEVLAQVLKPG